VENRSTDRTRTYRVVGVVRKIVGLTERFVGHTGPTYHSEKMDDFSALYICVRDQGLDGFLGRGIEGVRHYRRNV